MLLPATRAAVGLQSLPTAARETALALADVRARLDPARARASAAVAAEETGEEHRDRPGRTVRGAAPARPARRSRPGAGLPGRAPPRAGREPQDLDSEW